MENLNKEFYSTQILDEWQTRGGIIEAEEYLLSKYFKDKNKKIIEAGTGGGRLSYYLENKGFTDITAFDIVPEMIFYAKEKALKENSKIKFHILDATELGDFPENTFDYLMYLQQVLCFIPNEKEFLKSLEESYRISKDGAIIIYSFLDITSRPYNKILLKILNVLRFIRGEKRSNNLLPWMKINNKFNFKLLNKNQPLNYWVNKEKIVNELRKIGFKIVESKNANELLNNSSKHKGMLYIVCKK